MRVNVIIFYEHVKREFDSVSRLKRELVKLKVSTVILPIHYWKYKFLIKYDPDLIVMPYLYDSRIDAHRLFEKYNDRKIPVVNLASEQLLDKQTRTSHLPGDEYSRSAYHVAWSRNYFEALCSLGVLQDNILKIGNIRMSSFYEQLSHKEKITHVTKILVPTSFARSFIAQSYIKKIRVDFDEYMARVEHAKVVRDLFFKDIGNLAKKYPNIVFSFRPHPNVLISKYVDKLCEINNWYRLPNNVKLISEESIHKSISSNDLVISWYTTTIVDSYLVKTNHLVYDPLWDRSYSDNELFRNCDLVSVEDIERNLSQKVEFRKSDFMEKYIEDNFTYTSKDSVHRLALEISNILKKHYDLVGPKPGKKGPLESFYLVYKLLTIDVIKNFLLKFGVLHKVVPFYAGLLEDTLSDEKL